MDALPSLDRFVNARHGGGIGYRRDSLVAQWSVGAKLAANSDLIEHNAASLGSLEDVLFGSRECFNTVLADVAVQF